MNLEELNDNSICLIVWNTGKEDDVHVYPGKLHLENGQSYFVNTEKGWKVPLNKEQLSRLQPVSQDLKEILLNADYALSMRMGNLPETDIENFQETGMKWHD